MVANGDRLAGDLTKRAYAVVPHYIGVNWAIRQAGLIGRMAEGLFGSPLHLRLPVHAKPGIHGRRFCKEPPRPEPGTLPYACSSVWQENQERSKSGLALDLSGRVRDWTPLVWRRRMIGYEAQSEPTLLT